MISEAIVSAVLQIVFVVAVADLVFDVKMLIRSIKNNKKGE